MARQAGSKNKIKEQVDEIISEISELNADSKEKQDVIDELEDLLDSVPEDAKRFVGYSPINGSEIWE